MFAPIHITSPRGTTKFFWASTEGGIFDENLKPKRIYILNNGVRTIRIKFDGFQKHVTVSRLMAQAFNLNDHSYFKKSKNLYECVHKNGDKADNSYSNLCWRPRKYARRYNRWVETKSPLSIFPNPIPVDCIGLTPDDEEVFRHRYRTIEDAAIGEGYLPEDIFLALMEGGIPRLTFEDELCYPEHYRLFQGF